VAAAILVMIHLSTIFCSLSAIVHAAGQVIVPVHGRVQDSGR